MKDVLLAGATGYLGKHILAELENHEFRIRAITRNESQIENYNPNFTERFEAELTKPQTLTNICDDIDIVISTVGITKQKDGLTYNEVDYQANKNLLNEGIKSGVKKFIYISVLNGEKLRHLKICEAKEKFVDELKNSGLNYCIIRPNGFFSDMSEFYKMAKKGKVYLFGKGSKKANPIHGEDLAKVCVDAITKDKKQIEIGGPQTLSQTEIADIAFEVLNQKSKIVHIPDWVRHIILFLIKSFSSQKTYGPIEFFMTVMAIDMVAPEYGTHTLKEYYESLYKSEHL